MKIVVCSKNEAKNEAVKKVMKMFFSDFEIISLETNSGVSATPIDDEEGLNGCHNRINDAIKHNQFADLYIAMEGILTKTTKGYFLCGWTVIYDRVANNFMYGCSSKVKVPNNIVESLNKNNRLSELVAKLYNSTDDDVSKFGTNGVLTNGVYTRTDEFVDSVLCAISTGFKPI